MAAYSLSTTLHILPFSDPPYNLLQNHQSLSLLSKCKTLTTLKQAHSQIIKTGLHNTQYALSKLIESCSVSPCTDLSYALLLFESIEEPNQVIWNTVIRGYSLSSSPISALDFFVRMISSGVSPNSHTFPFLLKSCAKTKGIGEGKQIHAHVFKLGLDFDPFVHTSLINMYAQNNELDSARLVFDKCNHRDAVSYTALITGYASRGLMDSARKLFDESLQRDVVSWNALLAGYAKCGQYDDALNLFQEMVKENVTPNESTMLTVLSVCAQTGSIELGSSVRSTWIDERKLSSNRKLVNALIDMYAKCGDLTTARDLFEGISVKDVVSWNVMIGGYTRANRYKESLTLFREMLRSNVVECNDVTLLSVIPACAYLDALDLGKWIHAYVNKKFENSSCYTASRTAIWTSIITMYAKCGNIDAAKQVFDGMTRDEKTLSSWNAMIYGFAMNGRADNALDLFSRLNAEGYKPDDITFVGVLSACSHAGLLDPGRLYFRSMSEDYKLKPKLQHYGCVIDLLGRFGLFDEAESLMKSMEIEPDAAIWGCLLRACRLHRNVKLGEIAVNRLLELEPDNPSSYIVLSNIYAGEGRWDDVARIRTLINDNGLKKVPGCSSIEVDSVIHEFLVGDKAHLQHNEIYEMLNEIDTRLDDAGFVPDMSEVLYDVDDESKKGVVSHHSEKLAIAFGLISTKPGTTIRIVKNLRICGNCHEASKLISKIFDREIVARDRNRFHHFKNGVCSCNDYW